MKSVTVRGTRMLVSLSGFIVPACTAYGQADTVSRFQIAGRAQGPAGGDRVSHRSTRIAAIALISVLVFVASACRTTPPPSGGAFVDEVAISGLKQPTAVRFARNGKVF